MANRPIFTPSTKKDLLVETHDIDFQWSPGMAASQKKKNVQALHSSASEKLKIDSVLEVSSKSKLTFFLTQITESFASISSKLYLALFSETSFLSSLESI